jgi:hypothetical protein
LVVEASAAAWVAERPAGPAVAELLEPASARWSEALGRVPHDVYHLPGYAELDAGLSGGTARCLHYRDDGGTVLMPLVLRRIPGTDRVDACSPYGYPGPVSDADPDDSRFWARAGEAINAGLRQAGVVSCFIRLHPLLAPPLPALARHGALVQHCHTVSIDLTRSEDELWAQTRANHRRQINRARRDGIVVCTDGSGRLEEFVQIYHQTMTRVGAGDYYFFDAAYFDDLRRALGDAVRLVSVHAGGTDTPMIGGGLFFEHDGIVQYHLGATRDGHGAQQPTKVMFDDVRRWAKRRGCTSFHLGGGLGGRNDELFHFKAGFSDQHLPFHTWRLVTDRAAYTRLADAAGAPVTAGEPEGTGFFPAYRHTGAPASDPARSTR